ncbi:MAG: helix-turn-helix transcriptional regulator [Methylovulum sp.]|nr:helix-turn-helix transcriptional regulator [Methylovulum sp.]
MKTHDKIRLMREERNWSQEEMAEKLNMSTTGYAKIERGESQVYLRKLEQIAEKFGVDLIELLSVGEKHIYLIIDNSNNGCNVIGSSGEIAHELQKLQLTVQHQKELLGQQQREITALQDIITLLKEAQAK